MGGHYVYYLPSRPNIFLQFRRQTFDIFYSYTTKSYQISPNTPATMETPKKLRHKKNNTIDKTLEEKQSKPLVKKINDEADTDSQDQAIEYDYLKYPNQKKKNKLEKKIKSQKNVTFKMMVELVTYTDNWKMKMSESKLRTEEEQRKSSIKRRNF
ncbi:hypothetical protein KR009_004450 [Drosophila setifemur]|nr:hypothetical protein KR009_004450 [Drosophila setifemur]